MPLGEVTASSLNMRNTPSPEGPLVRIIPKGTRVSVLDTVSGGAYLFDGATRDSWHRIAIGAETGFVAAAYVAEVSPAVQLRGAWIPEGSHSSVLKTPAGIAEALDFLQEHGFNAVFPAVWNRGLTAFPSRVMERHGFAVQDPQYGGFDPLGAIVREGKKRGMAVLPWFEYGFASSPDADGGPILRAKPAWAALDRSGALVRHGPLVWMNSLHPEVQQFLLDLVVEAIVTYDVQGIQGDDHWPAMPFNAGHDPLSLAEYRTAKGIDPPADDRDEGWVSYRSDRMTDYLGRIGRTVKEAKPGCLVSMAPTPFPTGRRELMQDSDRWMRKGLVDFLHPQLYRSDAAAYKRDLGIMMKGWSPTLRARLAPGISFTANGRDLSATDIVAMVELNRELGLAGEVFFHYGQLRRLDDFMAKTLGLQAGYEELALLPPSLVVA